MTSLFISIEGGEGGGKSTLVSSLEEFFRKENKEVICTREPGGTLLGESIRKILLIEENMKPTPLTEFLLFLAARAEHVDKVIQPALSQGAVVICERFHDSTIVYQGIASGLGERFVTDICLQAIPLQPDITFLLDIPASQGVERKRVQKELDKIERRSLSFHDRVRKGFLHLAESYPERIKVLDASLDKEALAASAIEHLSTVYCHE